MNRLSHVPECAVHHAATLDVAPPGVQAPLIGQQRREHHAAVVSVRRNGRVGSDPNQADFKVEGGRLDQTLRAHHLAGHDSIVQGGGVAVRGQRRGDSVAGLPRHLLPRQHRAQVPGVLGQAAALPLQPTHEHVEVGRRHQPRALPQAGLRELLQAAEAPHQLLARRVLRRRLDAVVVDARAADGGADGMQEVLQGVEDGGGAAAEAARLRAGGRAQPLRRGARARVGGQRPRPGGAHGPHRLPRHGALDLGLKAGACPLRHGHGGRRGEGRRRAAGGPTLLGRRR
mmetsp:Transcript_28647/g.54849  ORF Transcript_28647/g.54849 Transcript_28647/m.54849 type:complete len:286 (-) Transcript_28647:709-1566(-)